jgi:hypothetical protein
MSDNNWVADLLRADADAFHRELAQLDRHALLTRVFATLGLNVPPTGVEPAPAPPEGDALSTELRG